MAFRYFLASKFVLLACFAHATLASNPCVANGVDFQDGHSYFQNSMSTDNFTFVSTYAGCQADNATNILTDPNGDQVQCSDTPLTPDNTPELSTCPTLKDQLISGDWSILILSNNGDGEQIAYERDFVLSVGPQLTTTFTPTITAPVTVTPVVNVTVTDTDTSKTTLTPVTTTIPSTTITPTTTVTPKRVTVRSTKTLLTIHKTKPTLAVIKTTKVVTATCKIPKKASTHMKVATITPTVGPIRTLPTANSAKLRRSPHLNDKAKFVAERRAYLAAANAHVVKRAPDAPTITVTDTNTADYVTVTSTSTAPATTATIHTTVETTQTITPAPVTYISGQSTLSKVTVTAPTPTRSITKYTFAYSYTTKTYSVTVTITSRTTPAASATACQEAGGIIK